MTKPTVLGKFWLRAALAFGVLLASASFLLGHDQVLAATTAPSQPCPANDSGLKLPAGFCASVFADGIGHARHLVVASNGVVYVNTWSGRYYANDTPHADGFLVALQDTSHSGRADVQQRFGETVQTGGAGGTGIALYRSYVYAENNDRIVRYALAEGSIIPQSAPEVVLSGLPLNGDHPMHPFVIDVDGNLYVDVATATNACQVVNRTLKSPGISPCTELDTRGGIWRYDAGKLNQVFSAAERYATGIRNADGMSLDDTGRGLYATQHGRDQLASNWPNLYKPPQGATLPAEELLRVMSEGDYGWPECYYDGVKRKLVLAPEYGGDGGMRVGVCAQKQAPIAAFPAHWAPNDLLLYYGKDFPSHYRHGAFIAFHGSWNRAPYPQGGYNIVFQPLGSGKSSGKCEIFADGFAGPIKDPQHAAHRPTGLALGPDGALYVSDDVGGRIYRIVYQGGTGASSPRTTPCPSASAPAGHITAVAATPPEGTQPNAGNSSSIPAAQLALGDRIYHGQEAAATCTGCHGSDGGGTPLGPNLRDDKWIWGSGSIEDIKKTIIEGVPNPKEYRSAMPPMGGAQLSDEQVSAVASYVWRLSHANSQ